MWFHSGTVVNMNIDKPSGRTALYAWRLLVPGEGGNEWESLRERSAEAMAWVVKHSDEPLSWSTASAIKRELIKAHYLEQQQRKGGYLIKTTDEGWDYAGTIADQGMTYADPPAVDDVKQYMYEHGYSQPGLILDIRYLAMYRVLIKQQEWTNLAAIPEGYEVYVRKEGSKERPVKLGSAEKMIKAMRK